MWNKVGVFTFSGSSSDVLQIANGVDSLKYIVADGIRITSSDSLQTEILTDPVILPDHIELYQNYPNPFNPSTTVRFQIGKRMSVNLSVYDILGQKVITLCNETLGQGIYARTFDGIGLCAGIYFINLNTEGYSQSKKMILLK
jgi:hypothetical protein